MVVLSTLVLTAAFALDTQMAQLASVMSKLQAAPEDEELGALGQEANYATCPPAQFALGNIHTTSQMQVTFTNSCAEVAAEVEARAQMQDGWTDPHNGGTYKLQESTSSMLTTTRTTANRVFTDKQTFALTTQGTGCVANICSASQGTSANDGGTNLCDMFDLFCNSDAKNPQNGVACKPVKTNLQYTINSQQCGRYVFGQMYATHQCQDALTTCLKVQSGQAEALKLAGTPPSHELQVVLGKYQTCPGAAYAVFNIHTMAQMQVTFTNSCAEVAGEIEARAGMTNGWEDPHNGGTYRLLSATASNIETSRTTRNRVFTDKQTFALEDSASGGCTAYMCSESQGTSANDGGTNLCDMYNLFCNSSETNPKTGVSCKPVKTNLQYTINSEECGRYVGEDYMGHQCQQANPTCLVNTQYSLAAPNKYE